MNRRTLLHSLAALGLVAAADPVIEPVRRYWALDRTMYVRPGQWQIVWRDPEHIGAAAVQVAVYRDRPDLPLFQWRDCPPMPQREQYDSGLVLMRDAHRLGTDARSLALSYLARDMAYVDDKPILL